MWLVTCVSRDNPESFFPLLLLPKPSIELSKDLPRGWWNKGEKEEEQDFWSSLPSSFNPCFFESADESRDDCSGVLEWDYQDYLPPLRLRCPRVKLPIFPDFKVERFVRCRLRKEPFLSSFFAPFLNRSLYACARELAQVLSESRFSVLVFVCLDRVRVFKPRSETWRVSCSLFLNWPPHHTNQISTWSASWVIIPHLSFVLPSEKFWP